MRFTVIGLHLVDFFKIENTHTIIQTLKLNSEAQTISELIKK